MEKLKSLKKTTRQDFITYAGVIIVFLIVSAMKSGGALTRSQTGLLVPICSYIVMAISLNLTVGILGELSLGHAGFMSVGAFAGVITSQGLINTVPNDAVRLALALIVGVHARKVFEEFHVIKCVHVDLGLEAGTGLYKDTAHAVISLAVSRCTRCSGRLKVLVHSDAG